MRSCGGRLGRQGGVSKWNGRKWKGELKGVVKLMCILGYV